MPRRRWPSSIRCATADSAAARSSIPTKPRGSVSASSPVAGESIDDGGQAAPAATPPRAGRRPRASRAAARRPRRGRSPALKVAACSGYAGTITSASCCGSADVRDTLQEPDGRRIVERVREALSQHHPDRARTAAAQAAGRRVGARVAELGGRGAGRARAAAARRPPGGCRRWRRCSARRRRRSATATTPGRRAPAPTAASRARATTARPSAAGRRTRCPSRTSRRRYRRACTSN